MVVPAEARPAAVAIVAMRAITLYFDDNGSGGGGGGNNNSCSDISSGYGNGDGRGKGDGNGGDIVGGKQWRQRRQRNNNRPSQFHPPRVC